MTNDLKASWYAVGHQAATEVDGTFRFGDKTGGGGLTSKTPSALKLIRQSDWKLNVSLKVTHLRKKLLRNLLTNSYQLRTFRINKDQLDPQNPTKKARISGFSADWAWLKWAITAPFVLLSAYLLLSKPRQKPSAPPQDVHQ